jgi:hypothetical protein
VIVYDPGVGSSYVTEHDPDETSHEEGSKFPVSLLELKLTSPDSGFTPESDTVAVQVESSVVVIMSGEQVTVVIDESETITVIDPELPWL